MATTTLQSDHSSAKSYEATSSYDSLIQRLKFSYFGIISMTILIGSCIGGISAMYILKNDAPIWQLGVCMAAAMANNVSAIGQAPIKWVVNLFLINFVLNLILILMNVI